MSLTPCVFAVVLSLYSAYDEIKPDHFSYENSDKRLNSIHVCGIDELYIEHFSHPASLLPDMTSLAKVNNMRLQSLLANLNIIMALAIVKFAL